LEQSQHERQQAERSKQQQQQQQQQLIQATETDMEAFSAMAVYGGKATDTINSWEHEQ